ncbi:hypothetical protein COBT_001796 [Conglomerata obtusa]
MKKVIIANWKANYKHSLLTKLAHCSPYNLEISIAPPYTFISASKQILPPTFSITAQNCSEYENGPYTGEISAYMLSQLGCTSVILGHSERRTHFHDTDEKIKKRLEHAKKANLSVILCVGETKEEKDKGLAQSIVEKQLSIIDCKSTLDIAYEPVYAIGTGIVPNTDEIYDMHNFIRNIMNKKNVFGRILYGGSVTKKNCEEFIKIKYVDGFLIGGASIKDEFFEILDLCNKL